MNRRQFVSSAVASLAAAKLGSPLQPELLPTRLELANAEMRLAPAQMADRLCDSYMINTKMFYQDTVYGHTHAVMDLLKELGVRIVRERAVTGNSIGARQQQYAMPRLANAGVRWHATVGQLQDWPNARSVNKDVMRFLGSHYAPQMGGDLSHMMHSLGGCNEIDGPMDNGHRDPHWAKHARRMQRQLWQQAKGHRATRNIRIAGPSTRTDLTNARAAALGDLSGMCDLGNGHLYNKGTSPSMEIDSHLGILRPCFPHVSRWIFTETGYNNSPQDNLGRTISEEASATYAVRGICDYFKRDAIYGRFELLDDPDRIDYTSQTTINQTADRNSHFGLVAMTEHTAAASTPDTWRKKPEFYATKRLMHLMSDRGAPFTARGLHMKITGRRPDLHTVLLQKRNGKHYLLMWRDVQVARMFPDARPIKVPAYDVTVHLQTARPTAVYAPAVRSGPLATHAPRGRVTVPMAGDLKIVEIG